MMVKDKSWLPSYSVSRSKYIAEAYARVAVIGNNFNRFRTAGVWPVNRKLFLKHLFEVADNMDLTGFYFDCK